MLILGKTDLEELLPMEEVLDVLAIGFREVKEGRCGFPVWFHLRVEEYQGQFLFMPAFLPGLKQSGTKIVSVFPKNTSKGKPTIYATYLLSDPTTEVWVYDLDPRRLESFCKKLNPLITVRPISNPSEAVRQSDILVTSTTSKTPVFSGKDLKPGVHINAIGAFRPDMRGGEDGPFP